MCPYCTRLLLFCFKTKPLRWLFQFLKMSKLKTIFLNHCYRKSKTECKFDTLWIIIKKPWIWEFECNRACILNLDNSFEHFQVELPQSKKITLDIFLKCSIILTYNARYRELFHNFYGQHFCCQDFFCFWMEFTSLNFILFFLASRGWHFNAWVSNTTKIRYN